MAAAPAGERSPLSFPIQSSSPRMARIW